MLTFLAEYSAQVSWLNVFRYITFRTGGAMMTALLFVFIIGPPLAAGVAASVGASSALALTAERLNRADASSLQFVFVFSDFCHEPKRGSDRSPP